MKKLVVLMGIPGSGKTWIRENYFSASEVVSLDRLEIRSRNAEDKLLLKILKTGKDIVVDGANVTKSKRRKYIELGHRFGYKVFVAIVDTHLHLAYARMDQRERKVPRGSMDGYANDLQWPERVEGWDGKLILWDDWDPKGDGW